MKNYGREEQYNIPSGYYKNIAEVLQLINSKIRRFENNKKAIVLKYNDFTRKVRIEIHGNSSICFNEELVQILGFKCSKPNADVANSVFSNLFRETTDATGTYDLPSSPYMSTRI